LEDQGTSDQEALEEGVEKPTRAWLSAEYRIHWFRRDTNL